MSPTPLEGSNTWFLFTPLAPFLLVSWERGVSTTVLGNYPARLYFPWPCKAGSVLRHDSTTPLFLFAGATCQALYGSILLVKTLGAPLRLTCGPRFVERGVGTEPLIIYLSLRTFFFFRDPPSPEVQTATFFREGGGEAKTSADTVTNEPSSRSLHASMFEFPLSHPQVSPATVVRNPPGSLE